MNRRKLCYNISCTASTSKCDKCDLRYKRDLLYKRDIAICHIVERRFPSKSRHKVTNTITGKVSVFYNMSIYYDLYSKPETINKTP